MSFFAGAVDFTDAESPRASINPWLSDMLESGEATVFEGPHFSVCHVDLGAFGEAGTVVDEAGLTIVAGHPFLGGDTAEASADGRRGAHTLHGLDQSSILHRLRDSHGVFALVCFDANDKTLTLATDRLGIRPVYWWTDSKRVVFSTRLADVVAHPWVPSSVDERGLVEFLSLGYSLGRRTPYIGVNRICSAEVVQVTSDATKSEDWADVGTAESFSAPSPEEMVDRLRAAVARRLTPGPQVTFLSGGLDSRVVAVLLREKRDRIFSFNFSPAGSQDRVYAERLASLLGATHHSSEAPPRPHWSQLMADAIKSTSGDSSVPAPPVWSGDGGSVCLGWVYVDPEICDALSAGDFLAASRLHLDRHASRIPDRDLKPGMHLRYREMLEGSIVSILEGYAEPDPVARFFRFLVENDQRRHLDRHFESLLDHRTEFWLPFFDNDVLEPALRLPPEMGRGHQFYSQWFDLLGPEARSTPWQTYPGHIPCPIAEEGHGYQWSNTRPRRIDRMLGREVLGMLLSGDLPSSIVQRRVVAFRAVLQAMGLRDSSGLLYWLASLGRYTGSERRRTMQ